MTTETLTRKSRHAAEVWHEPEEDDRTVGRAVRWQHAAILPSYWTAVTKIIGIKSTVPQTIVEQIKNGLPATTIHFLQQQMDITNAQLAATVNIPGRTLSRRIREGRLRSDESERVVRIARLFARTVQLLGTTDHARQWLKTPKRALSGKTPLEYADTEPGAEEVANLLGRLDHGVFT